MLKKFLAIVLIIAGLLSSGILQPISAEAASNYTFDGLMTQEVMENYLSKSVHIMDLCNNYQDIDKRTEWLRFISNTGAKFIGRAAMNWSDFEKDETIFSNAVSMADAVHSQDPECILQAAIFETTATTVSSIAIPSWVFTEFGLPVENRNFNCDAMLYSDGRYVNQWGTGVSVPDITKLETQMFFFYRAKRFIDAGYEAIHFGQVNLMGELDPFYINWNSLFKRVRNYAYANARRHNVLLDAHTNNVYDNCDPLWYSAKGAFRYETGNTQNYFNGDYSKLNRVDGVQTEDGSYIIYKVSGLTSFEILSANGAHYGDIPKAYNIFTSQDGINWTNSQYNSEQIFRNDQNWPNYKMTNQSSIPEGTNYLKISWKVLNAIWLAQLMDVKITGDNGVVQDTFDEPKPVNKKLGLDFIGYPARMKAKEGYPQETYFEFNYLDSFYGKTIGGIDPQGFTCEHCPYLIELDNYGGNNGNPGVDAPFWPWGYDEIAWFDHQSDSYRHSWLKYAYDWIRNNDPAGHLQMPGFRCTSATTFYSAIMPSSTFPNGRGDETTIKNIFANLNTVIFKDWDDTVLKTETVEQGKGATAPDNPTRKGYTFTGWNKEFSNVTGDLTVTAQYSQTPTVTLQSIAITTPASKLVYTVGDSLDTSGMAVTGTYSDGTAKKEMVTAANVTGFDSSSPAAIQTLTVTVGGKTATYTITVNAVQNNNNNNNSGGSGSSSGSSSVVTPPAEENKIEMTVAEGMITATVTAKATVDNSGKATTAVTQTQVSSAISKAVEEAAKQGNGTAATAAIKVKAPAGAKTVEASLPKKSVDAVADSNLGAFTLLTPIAAITFDEKALDTISEQAACDVKISVAKVDAGTLGEETKQLVGDRPVFSFSMTSGNKVISQFGGNVKVSVPYTPKAGEDINAIMICYINAEGKPEIVSNCVYEPVTSTIGFTTNHFSWYAVGYNKVSFRDVLSDAWYSKAVGFVAARNITKGTGDGNYSPNAKLTRAEFLVMMMRAYGIAGDTNPADNFADSGDTYYTGYLAAAKSLGITGGVGNNMFAPDKEITRQEMFTLLYNTLKEIGSLPQCKSEKQLSSFRDAEQIAEWAKDAMKLFTQTGTISGNEGRISASSATTRAEIAQVLYNLLTK